MQQRLFVVPTTGGVMTQTADVRRFMYAGYATFTLRSKVTGDHYTFQVRKANSRFGGPGVDRYFVSVLSGPDNTSDYTYLGTIDGSPFMFRLTKASKFLLSSPPVKAFMYLHRIVERPATMLPTDLEFRHMGQCGRCHRPLTHPDSIDRGIGPECASIMGLI